MMFMHAAFVLGFPGIPGSQERPHAAVKGVSDSLASLRWIFDVTIVGSLSSSVSDKAIRSRQNGFVLNCGRLRSSRAVATPIHIQTLWDLVRSISGLQRRSGRS